MVEPDYLFVPRNFELVINTCFSCGSELDARGLACCWLGEPAASWASCIEAVREGGWHAHCWGVRRLWATRDVADGALITQFCGCSVCCAKEIETCELHLVTAD
jgi:hypothetical protein